MSDIDEYFRFKCFKGLQKRGVADKQEYIDRLNYEIKIILQMGFSGYFLVVSDFTTWAKNNNVMPGPGRGSAAGSLCTYCLYITDLDPIKYGLLFERFLNPSRVSLPDIDSDFNKNDRNKVIDYVIQKYGQDHVAHIATFGYLKAKSSVKDVAKKLGHPYEVGDRISKLLLDPIHGKYQSISESISKVPELGNFVRSKGIEAEILQKAIKVENTIKSVGVHASGIVIANNTLLGNFPTFLGKGEEITTQWDMKNIEQAGLIKFDFLGLDTLDRIKLCLELVKKNHKTIIDITDIPVDDTKVFENLQSGDTVGIFQLEASTGIKDLLIQIKPTNLEDIILLVALYRPGPLGHKSFHQYLEVRQGRAKPEYLIPELKPILSVTDGMLVYQEQVLQIAKDLCGYSLADADLLRRAIGKKIDSEMAAQKKGFLDGWKKNGYPIDKGDSLWEQIVSFADYAFNRSHSACYGLITYQTAWLKTHYPIEWMTAILICEGNAEQVIKYIAECKRLNIKVLPPDINRSEKNFSIDEDDNIRFGIAPIKNLGEGPVEEILSKRSDGRFDSLMDFCDRVDLSIVNRLKLESLIKAGAFDNANYSRAAMVSVVDSLWNYRKDLKSYTSKLETYNKKCSEVYQRDKDISEGKLSAANKPLKPLSTPLKPIEPEKVVLNNIPEFPEQDLLQFEHELLGYFVTAHPMDQMKDTIIKDRLRTIDQIKELPHKTKVSFGAVITNVKEMTTAKTKQKMAFLTLEDTTGQVDAAIFTSTFAKFKDLLTLKVPLRFDGSVEVTESDEERVVKVSVFSITVLVKKEIKRKSILEISVPIDKARKLTEDIHKGNSGAMRITFDFPDGTKVKCTETIYIDKGTVVI